MQVKMGLTRLSESVLKYDITVTLQGATDENRQFDK